MQRHRFLTPALALMLLAAAPLRADCPPAPDHEAEIDKVLAELQEVETEAAARPLSNQLWEYWADAPDEPAQELLDQGMRARGAFDFLGAEAAFDKLVDYCPDYAEGYNQRAFGNFMQGRYEFALPDLEAALEINPRHVAALSGKALTLFALGRDDDAQEALREAVDLNPWISERHLLEPEGEEL